MLKEKCSFKDALFKADTILNEPDKYNLVKTPNHKTLKDTLPFKKSQLEMRAKQYFDEAKPLNNTLAQTYLVKQGIDIKTHENLRFHPMVYSSETRKTYPALIANITNDKDETKAIEVTYLNPKTANKEALNVDKRVLGSKSGNNIKIYKGSNTKYSILAVGIENALNIDNKNDVDIHAVNNNNDIKTIKPELLRDNIIVILDKINYQNKNQISDHILNKLTNENKTVQVIDTSTIQNSEGHKQSLNQLINSAINDIDKVNKHIPLSIQTLSNDIINGEYLSQKNVNHDNINKNKTQDDLYIHQQKTLENSKEMDTYFEKNKGEKSL